MPVVLDAIIEDLRLGATVLTVNRRLSQHLHAEYNGAQLRAGKSAWETPSVLPIGAWLDGFYKESIRALGRQTAPLLGENRSRTLWLRVVERGCTEEQRGLLSAQGVGESSYGAYKLMGEYNLSSLGSELYMTDEVKAFDGWLKAYRRSLSDLGFIDRTQLKARVVELINEGAGPLPGVVLFSGFDELTPFVRLLSSSLRGAGVRVERLDAGTAVDETVQTMPVVRRYIDEVAEVRAAARWVRKKLNSYNRTVGVVVPDLGRYRALLQREFSAELDPKSVLPWQEFEGVYNISLGAPLYDTPLVRSAFDLLSISGAEIELLSTSSLLLSRYLAGSEERQLALAQLDVELKRKKVASVSLAELRSLLEEKGGALLSATAKKIGGWLDRLKAENSPDLPSVWAGRFATLLALLGWPSTGSPLSSSEYQSIEAFKSVLGEFSGFDDMLGRLTRPEAVSHLRRVAIETIHQVESPDSSVQVLGIFEASGLTFDSLLLLGADSNALPGPRNPNPFIPIEIQKQLDFQDSTPERTLLFAAGVLARVIGSATDVEISYASCFGGVESGLSPLLKSYEVIGAGFAKEPGSSLKERSRWSTVLEEMPNELKVPMTHDELTWLVGGTGIVKDQSACPFRAFAVHRLGARSVAAIEPGFDAMDRGTTLHEALKFFWRKVRDSRNLKDAVEKGELDSLVKEAVGLAIGNSTGRNLPVAYLELEAARVEALVSEWLTLELSRESFTVKATECAEEIEVGGLQLRARFDRVDTLENGGELIIDYKTGECKQDFWLPGRPKEPQLLLYDLAGDFDALAFARVKLKGTKFVGVARDGAGLPGIKPINEDRWTEKIEGVENWDDLKARWRETLEAIVGEFTDGVVRVEPDSTFEGQGHPCTFCDLTPLCRRYELNKGPRRE